MSLRKNQIGEWCNGNTADSDSVFWGSNPYSPAKEKQTTFGVCFSFLWQRNRRAEPQRRGALPRRGVLPLGEKFDQITHVALISTSISSLGKIPPLRVGMRISPNSTFSFQLALSQEIVTFFARKSY